MNIKYFLETYDFEGIAKAYRESEIAWSENEWKEFIETIKKQERERVIEVIKSKLDRKDNPVLDAGLMYALTVLEVKD